MLHIACRERAGVDLARVEVATNAHATMREKHAVQNVSDKDYEVIIVELKAKPAATNPVAKKQGNLFHII